MSFDKKIKYSIETNLLYCKMYIITLDIQLPVLEKFAKIFPSIVYEDTTKRTWFMPFNL